MIQLYDRMSQQQKEMIEKLEQIINRKRITRNSSLTINYTIGSPKDLSDQDKKNFLELLLLQNQTDHTIEKIESCIFICIEYLENLTVGIGAIKNIYNTPFDKANVPHLKNVYKRELGYLYVLDEEKFRGKGIARDMCTILLEKVKGQNVFASTEESETAIECE